MLELYNYASIYKIKYSTCIEENEEPLWQKYNMNNKEKFRTEVQH